MISYFSSTYANKPPSYGESGTPDMITFMTSNLVSDTLRKIPKGLLDPRVNTANFEMGNGAHSDVLKSASSFHKRFMRPGCEPVSIEKPPRKLSRGRHPSKAI